jgi:hypothetical protein
MKTVLLLLSCISLAGCRRAPELALAPEPDEAPKSKLAPTADATSFVASRAPTAPASKGAPGAPAKEALDPVGAAIRDLPVPSALVTATSSAVPPATAAPSSAAPNLGYVPCMTVDDCWVSGPTTAARPIARPFKHRGRKFQPCIDGEAAPVCAAGRCAVRGYEC